MTDKTYPKYTVPVNALLSRPNFVLLPFPAADGEGFCFTSLVDTLLDRSVMVSSLVEVELPFEGAGATAFAFIPKAPEREIHKNKMRCSQERIN